MIARAGKETYRTDIEECTAFYKNTISIKNA
jgi:hypothetical protein